MLRLATKTTGLGADILKNKAKLGKIKYVMFSGKYIVHEKINPEEVDLLIVGAVVLPEVALLVRNEEARYGNEINYTVMTEEEFDFSKITK